MRLNDTELKGLQTLLQDEELIDETIDDDVLDNITKIMVNKMKRQNKQEECLDKLRSHIAKVKYELASLEKLDTLKSEYDESAAEARAITDGGDGW